MHPRQCYCKHNPRAFISNKNSFLVLKATGFHQNPARQPTFKGTSGTAGRDLSRPVICVDVVLSGSAGIGSSFAAQGGGTEGHRQRGLTPVIKPIFFKEKSSVIKWNVPVCDQFQILHENCRKRKKKKRKRVLLV